MMFFSRFMALLQSMHSVLNPKIDLTLENFALRQQLAAFKKKNPRPKLSRLDRILWVLLRMCWHRWQSALLFVNPETVAGWHRKGFRLYWKYISDRGKGKVKDKHKIDKEIRDLIYKLANENPTWRAPRIHGELLKLGFRVSERTVSRYLPKREPSGDKIKKWMTFLNNHRKGIMAMDFFTVPTFFFRQLYCFFIIHHDRRKIIHFNVTFNPTEEWVKKQLRSVFSLVERPKYMIYDRDTIFSALITGTLKSFSIEPVRTSFRSPWQNGTAERWVGSVRKELLNHVIILNKEHLYKLLEEYIDYYHNDRTHYNLDKDPPNSRPVQDRASENDRVIAMPRVGGLHHKYVWKDAA